MAALIMVVEDETMVADLLRQQLTRLGYELAGIATSGQEALARVGEVRPDLVLMDVHIEGELDGIETAARLPEELEIPVVFMTGNAEEATLARARMTRPYGYLIKPFNARELNATIEMTLERRAAYMALRESEQRLRQALDAAEEGARNLALANQHLQAEISERRSLERKNAEMERFCYTISHDLKAPLVTIRGFADLLRQDFAERNQDELSDDIEEIAKAAGMLQSMLDDLLELSRNGQIADASREVALATVVEHALRLLSAQLTASQVVIEVGRDLPVAVGDYGRLVAVFQNLVDNAIKYRRPQVAPRIEVTAKAENGQVVCSVRDNGAGIDPRYHERVFDLFVRLQAGISGKGIGLALVKRIIEAHGGRIWLESNGEGHGCTFSFTLPVAPSHLN